MCDSPAHAPDPWTRSAPVNVLPVTLDMVAIERASASRHIPARRRMGIIRDMQRAHATQTAAEHRASTAAAQQRELIRRNADLAIAAAQQAANDAERQR